MTSWEIFTSKCRTPDCTFLFAHFTIHRFIFYEAEQSKVLVLQDKVKGHLEELMRHIKGNFGGVIQARVRSHRLLFILG